MMLRTRESCEEKLLPGSEPRSSRGSRLDEEAKSVFLRGQSRTSFVPAQS